MRAAAGLTAVALTGGWMLGCVSTSTARRSADDTAYRIVDEKRYTALGREEEFSIERPEDTLRRRLQLDQQLPAAGPASFGVAYLPPVPKQPSDVPSGQTTPDDFVYTGFRDAPLGNVYRENFSTDIFLREIGTSPEGGRVDPDLPPPVAPATRPAGPAGESPDGESRSPDASETAVYASLTLGPASPAEESELARQPLVLSIVDALQIGARNSREYQTQKENVYVAALQLDLQRDRFELTFGGLLTADAVGDFSGDSEATGVRLRPQLNASKLFKTGASVSTAIGLDLARLLSGGGATSLGAFADVSATIPLLRGAGREIVTEPLVQAERDAIYAIWQFERFRHVFAVNVVRDYLGVLADLDAIANNQANYDRLLFNARRAQSLFDEGRLNSVQVDQIVQTQLRARDRLIASRQRYEQRLDNFKLLLGLPTDARIALMPEELVNLTQVAERVLGPVELPLRDRAEPDPPGPSATSPVEPQTLQPRRPEDATREPPPFDPELGPRPTLPEEEGLDPRLPPGTGADVDRATLDEDPLEALERAREQAAVRRGIEVALQRRTDLAVAFGAVRDAQRRVVVAADGLRAGLNLAGSASYGGRRSPLQGGLPDAELRFDQGIYNAGVTLDLPIERTAERNAYRVALINLDRNVRTAQDLEDRVKLDIINGLRNLRTSGETLRTQAVAISVAARRADAANLFLETGRGQARDLTEAEDALVTAQNAFSNALISYRLSELELQRDLGLLEVDAAGLFREVPIDLVVQ